MIETHDCKIATENGDVPEFIDNLNTLITSLICRNHFDEIFIVKINNWVDHNWLNYSGKSVVAFQGGDFIEIESALQNEWREKVTVPPFNPNRILSEQFFNINSDKKLLSKRLHKTRTSNENIHNRICNYSNNGLFIWYSSGSEKNKKGSVMVYKVQEENVQTFYVSFEKNTVWKIKQAKGISTEELRNYLSKEQNIPSFIFVS